MRSLITQTLALLAFASPAQAAYSEAYQAAFEKTLTEPGDLDGLFRFAELALREGDLEGAIAALERLLLLSGDVPTVHIQLGGLYLRIGAHEQAAFYARSALATPNLDAPERRRAEALLALVEFGASRHRLSGSLGLAMGYQSNTNSAPAESPITVAGETYELEDDALAQPDANGFVSGALVYVYDPKLASGLSVDAALSGAFTKQLEQSDYDFISAGLAAGPRLRLGAPETGASIWLHGLATLGVLGGELYVTGFGGGLTLAAPLADGLWTDVVAEVSHLKYRDGDVATSASERSGLAPRGALQLRYRLLDHLWLLGAGHASTTRAQEASEANSSFGGLAGLSVPFAAPLWTTRPWTVDLVYDLTLIRYDEADADVDAETQRKDIDHRVSGRLHMPMTEHVTAFVSGSYARHGSTLELYVYSGVSASAGATYSF